VQLLRENKAEINNLYNDILIGVTEFFRDREVFVKVQEHLQNIIDKKEQGEEIRLWCIGCSTGEEAYSLAILLHEVLQEKISKYKIKIFATDIDDEALKIARIGVYVEASLMGMKKEYKERYFTIVKNQLEIKKSVRELVIFSKHNIVSDSPFLRIDYLSCRNMLIYFNKSLQDRFFPIIHYALKESGILTLGLSESLGEHLDLFIPVDKKHNIYKAQFTGAKEAPRLYKYSAGYSDFEEKPQTKKKNEDLLEESLSEAILSLMFNQCALINSSDDIIYIKGKIPFIEQPQGRATNNIFKCINQDLSLELRTALSEAKKTKTTQSTPVVSMVLLDSIEKYVKITIVPVKNKSNGEYLYTLFFQTEKLEHIYGYVSEGVSDNETIEKLRLELSRTKNHLQNLIEQLEASYEEMQGLNEELSSSNEELQSSNEELETTNEELQSTNEELQTAYTELKITYDVKEDKAKKLQEISHALQNEQESMLKQQRLTDTLIESVPVGIIMLDEDGRLSIMNQNAKSILALDFHNVTQGSMHENAQRIIEQNLPFEIVKKTYEPIYRVGHIIEKNGNEAVSITVNGMPLFDNKGAFIGAVFSMVDNLSVESMNSSLKNTSMQELDPKEQFGVLELGLLDVLCTIQSYLGDLSFFTQALTQTKLNPKAQSELQESINSKINNIATIIESNVNYYKEITFLEKTPFTILLKRYIKILNQISTGDNIAYLDMLKGEISLECNPRKASLFFIQLFSKLHSALIHELKSENILLEVSWEENSLIIFLKGVQISPKFTKSLTQLPALEENHGIKGLKSICIKDTFGKSICI